ncbi:hypothetical protein N752_17265 [Desulforamulus aquiferis]|nr:hypothetical protein N752_17265 [Desulforamulus aquiferis]
MGRKEGLKILRFYDRAGSTPAPGTNNIKALQRMDGSFESSVFYFASLDPQNI